MSRKLAFVSIFGALLLATIIYLSSGARKTSDAVPATEATVSVRMKWFYAGTMTPWFAAVDQGYFKRAGLNVTINPGGPDNSSIKLVAADSDQFGVAGAEEILLARAKGIPVVAIAVIFKQSPVCFIGKQGKGLGQPTAWTGKTIEVAFGGNEELQYRALLRKYSIKPGKEVPYTFNLVPFIENKVDVSVAYCMDQVVTLQRQGIAVDIVYPKDHGVLPYGDVVFTTEKTLATNPALVANFLTALQDGVKYSLSNPQSAVDSLVKFAPSLKKENELAVWNASLPYLLGGTSVDTALRMEDIRWVQTQGFLINGEALKAGGEPVDKAYKIGLVK